MQPLLQMHQMVQHPPQLDPLTSYQAHLNPEFLSFEAQARLPRPVNIYQDVHGAALPQRTAYPIGSSQTPHVMPALHRLTTNFGHSSPSDHGEHSLRRKTPRGTIDNGYDGSLAHLATGPPATKQLIMSAPPTSMYPGSMLQTTTDSAASTYQRALSATNWPSYATLPSPQTMNMAMGGIATPGPSGMTWVTSNAAMSGTIPVANPAQLLQSLSHTNMAAASRLQPAFVPSYQQNGSPVVYSPGALAQTPLWRGDLFPDYRNSVPVVTGYAHQNAAYDGAFLPSQPNMMHGLSGTTSLGLGPQFQLPMSALPLDDGFARYSQVQARLLHSPNRRLEALSLNSATTPNGSALGGDGPTPFQARFKERALAHAHKTYADLLVYLSHSKRAQHARDGSGSTKAVKMMVFPKPPKQLTSQLGPTRPRMPHSMTDPLLPYHARAASHSSFAPAQGGRLADAALSPSDVPSRYLGWTSTVAADMVSHPNMRYPLAHGKPGQMRAQDLSSPPHSARACLDVLSTLCEQSEWKWIDGILLGGCLQYGLEHYEDAVVWFNRILDLDPNHVETLSNIAATLYCLNRLKEAEEYWLKAIQIRPSYLEAVEHMVGLLCSNGRSEEAVQVISTVLEALRLPDARPRHGPIGADGFPDNPSGSSRRPSLTTIEEKQHAATFDMHKQPGFGSSGYAVPGVDNGRILLLVHARGNMLYALKQVDRASQAFEEAVMISAGRKYGSVQALIRKIQTVLRPRDASQVSRGDAAAPLNSPLLLAPDRAKHTSQLVFASSGGHLPGLRYIAEGSHRRAAISTTSNALLSLAKIFQDASTSGSGGPGTPGALGQAAGVGDILALYYLSLSLQESPSTANNVGILLAGVQQGSAVQLPVVDSAMVQQQIPGIVPGSGLSLALAYYKYGLQLDPKHVHLHTNLGSLLKDIGQLDLAINMYESAVACDGTFDIALTNLANAVKDRGKIYDAIVYYKRAVQSNPDFAEAVCGLSTALNSVCDWRNRGGVVLEAGRFDRWHVDEEGMLVDAKMSRQGVGLMKRVVDIVEKQLNEAAGWGDGLLRQDSVLRTLVSQLSDAGARITDSKLDLSVELQKWADRPWEGSRIVRLVERSTRAATHRWYRDRHLKGVEAAVGYPRARLPSGLTIPVAPTVLPFHTFTCPLTARDIRLISQRNALRISASTLRSPWLPHDVYPPPKPPAPHLNIGYLSSDFNNHPLAHLMQSVFGFHNPTRAKAFCYATTASDKSAHRLQIEREAPVFRDVSTWSSEKLVDQIVQDDIHILVNLNGYTRGARNEIFAARPAPIQMSFMGFAGTLGSEWCDYLLADSTAVPPSTLRPHRSNLTLQDVFRDEADSDKDGWVYSENIIFCRDTFFCCDHAQAADAAEERAMTWDQELQRRWRMRKELFPNLPDNAIILGNFNQLYKIDPTTFRSWLRILQAVPTAYLWLLRFPDLGETHLRRTARQWAGEDIARRILFTDVAPKAQHISRARVCDLFLDTPECNAHTTAADVLWSSTPLLTLPRYEYKMCSRMAASILKGALPKNPAGKAAAKELVAADEDEYERFAIRLASGLTHTMVSGQDGVGYVRAAGRLADLRKLLWDSKWTCPLFDTRRWVRDLEDAYDEAWRRWVEGEGGDIHLDHVKRGGR